jgi:hypothetical protein
MRKQSINTGDLAYGIVKSRGHLARESHNKTTAHLVFFMLSVYIMSKILDNFFWLLFGNNIFI